MAEKPHKWAKGRCVACGKRIKRRNYVIRGNYCVDCCNKADRICRIKAKINSGKAKKNLTIMEDLQEKLRAEIDSCLWYTEFKF